MMIMRSLFARSAAAAALCVVLGLTAGCGGSSIEPQFVLNTEGKDPAEATDEQMQQLFDVLSDMFGSPDDPYVFPEAGLDLAKIQFAAGPSTGSRDGVTGGLFRRNCVHCHGISGDGAGPTAAFLNPYPRDYRRGVFKFKSTVRAARPTDDDLMRTLVQGIPGTAMPSFRLLPKQELEALVEYVKYLSIRGETEELLYRMIVYDEETLSRDLVVEAALAPVVSQWQDAVNHIVVPVDPPEDLAQSIARGRELYQGKVAQCTKCHGPTGLGDGAGAGADVYDDWNKEKNLVNPEFWALPKVEIKPRNLRLGIYHGGRRPVDLYRRIHEGINGTPMPTLGRPADRADDPNAPGLPPAEIWDLVNYVRTLPYDGDYSGVQTMAAALKPR